MSKRTSSAATNGGAQKAGQVSCTFPSPESLSPLGRQSRNKSADIFTPATTAYDKQKDLLSSETGHFSLIRAMHLADLITEMNGTRRPKLAVTASSTQLT